MSYTLMMDIDGTGNYFVTECGRLFSAKYRKLRELSTWPNVEGYIKVKVHNRGLSLHRLVASAFCENPEGLETVDHIDNNKDNNHHTNLRWMSREDNAGRAGRGTYTMVSPEGVSHTFTGLAEFCRENGLTQANLSKVVVGQRPHHKGWKISNAKS